MMHSVTGAEHPRAGARVEARARGEHLAGFIYGTIVALSVVVAGAKAYPDSPGRVAVLVTITTGVLWLAHVYSFSLGHSVTSNEHLSFDEVRRIAGREASIIRAAVPPVAVLLLGAVGVLGAVTAFWAALGAGLVVLAGQGILFARIERLGVAATIVVVAVNVGLGVVLIGLKVLVGHL